jgi:hypothetical protein
LKEEFISLTKDINKNKEIYIEEAKNGFTELLKNKFSNLSIIADKALNMKKINFIINYANNLDNLNINELESFVNNDDNYIFILDIINAAIQAKSKKIAAILGVYAGKIISKQIKIEHKDLIILEALKSSNDYDLNNFEILYEKRYIIEGESIRESKHNKQNYKNDNFENSEMNHSSLISLDNQNSFLISVNKLKKLQILSTDKNTKIKKGYKIGILADYFHEVINYDYKIE